MSWKNWSVSAYRGLSDPIRQEGPWALENRGPADQGGSGKYYADRGRKILGICLHITAGLEDYVSPDGSAEATTNYGRTTSRAASWSMIVDSDSIIPSLQDRRVGWTQGVSGYNFNRPLWGVEIGKGHTNWNSPPEAWTDAVLLRLAVVCAPRVIEYGIPLRLVRNRDTVQSYINRGVPVGFCYHSDLTPSTRSDPGLYKGAQTFPIERFFEFLRKEVALRKGSVPTPTPTPPGDGRPVLKYGSKGDYVRGLQYDLNRVFPSYSKLAVDGSFGRATEGVVKEFQRRVKIDSDGSVGPVTWGKLALSGIKPRELKSSSPAPKPPVFKPYDRVVTARSGLNVRSGAGGSYRVVGGLKYGARVTVVGESGGWRKLKSPAGWVHGDYLGSVPSKVKYKVTARAGLNVRSGPGTGYKVSGTVPLGTVVVGTGKVSGSWVEAQSPWQLKNGVKGWYHSDYLKKV